MICVYRDAETPNSNSLGIIRAHHGSIDYERGDAVCITDKYF